MEFTFFKPVNVDLQTVKVRTLVRYPEDSSINDGTGWVFDSSSEPNMPCMEREDGVLMWCPEIDINKGVIKNWIKGVAAEINYKVCDEFECSIFDSGNNEVLTYEGYVPSFMDTDGTNCGDYIELTINKHGHIDNWKFTSDHVKELINEFN